MANQQLFQTIRGAFSAPAKDANRAGAPAYRYSPKHLLAQYAVTGCLNNTFYAGGAEQLETVLALSNDLDAEFIAKTAVYARQKASMKDMPALLLAVLSTKSPEYLRRVFDRVIDNGRMLRTFVQIMRSGAVGRKSLGSAPKALVRNWLDAANDRRLIEAAVGSNPSLADIVRMVHPKPNDPVREALQDAMEMALENVGTFGGRVVVCPDVSGSMSSPVTGARRGASSAVRCIDVAGLVAAAVARANRDALVLPFAERVCEIALNMRDTVMTNAERLASIGGGGTNCSAPLAWLNARKVRADLLMFVSDNQSWVDARNGATEMMRQWGAFKARNGAAKLVCIDIQPYGTTQALERADVLNVGGFSDEVFDVVNTFAAGAMTPRHWVGKIEEMTI